jgi:type II secretory pathway pseudopilin PulG
MPRTVSASSLADGIRRRGRGFTILEILVIMAIIAVLLSILLPTVSKLRERAHRLICVNNVRQLAAAVIQYANVNQGRLPHHGDVRTNRANPPGVDPPRFRDEDWIHWQTASGRTLEQSAIAPYLGAGARLKEILRCPTDVPEQHEPFPFSIDGKYEYSYTINGLVSGPSGSRKFTEFVRPSNKIMFAEPAKPYFGWYWGDRLTTRHGHAPKTAFPLADRRIGSDGGINVSASFFDGHADSITQDFADDGREHYVSGE